MVSAVGTFPLLMLETVSLPLLMWLGWSVRGDGVLCMAHNCVGCLVVVFWLMPLSRVTGTISPYLPYPFVRYISQTPSMTLVLI